MKLLLEQKISEDLYSFHIIKEDKIVGNIEIIDQANINTLYIDNIVKDRNYKGKRLVKEVVDYLVYKYKCNITCLPLAQYRKYYESLGFVRSLTNGEDIYYTLYFNSHIS